MMKMKIELALGANTGYNGERKVDEGPDGVESLRTRRSLCPRRFILLISPRMEQRAARSLEKQVPRVKRERDRKSKAKPPSMGRQLRADFVSIKLMKTERGRGVEGREREKNKEKSPSSSSPASSNPTEPKPGRSGPFSTIDTVIRMKSFTSTCNLPPVNFILFLFS